MGSQVPQAQREGVDDVSTDGELESAMEAALGRGDIRSFIAAEEDLENHILAQAYPAMERGDYAAAASTFQRVHDLNLRLVECIDLAAAEEDDDGYIQGRRSQALRLAAEALGSRGFALGEAARLDENYDEAASYFRQSATDYTRGAEMGGGSRSSVMSTRAAAKEVLAKGLEGLSRANFATAALHAMRAKVKFDVLVEDMGMSEGDDEWRVNANEVAQEACACAAVYHLASLRDQLARGNGAVALEHGNELCDAHERLAELLPEDLPRWLRHIFLGDQFQGLAFRALAQAEVHKDERRWIEGIAAYKDARLNFQRAAESVLQSGRPGAVATQEELLNEASFIDTSIRETERARQLDARVASLEAELQALHGSLVARLRDSGVVVHNTAEIVATIDQQAHFVQNVEVTVRAHIEELRNALPTAELSVENKDAIEALVRDLLADQEHGPRFLDKVRRTMKSVEGIVKVAGAIAGPIPAIIAAVGSLVH